MIKAVFADMDKTIVRTIDGVYKISDEDVEAINQMKAEGIHFVITTGRYGESIKTDMKKYGIWCDRITSSGSAVTIDDEVHIMAEIDPYLVEEMYELMNSVHPEFYSNIVINEEVTYRYSTIEGGDPRCNNEEYLRVLREHHHGINKVQFRFAREEDMNDIRKLTEKYFDRVSPNYNSVLASDYTAVGVNKGAAIRYMCERYGIGKEETAGIGDAENDIPIMDATQYNFAMKESHPALFEHVQYKVGSIREMYDIIKEINGEK